MKVTIAKLLILLSFTVIFFGFQASSVFAKDLSVVTVTEENVIEELTITEDTVVNAEEGLSIPKLIIKDGAEVVEINSEVQTLEVTAQNNVELTGEGDITNVIISTDKKVAVNTTGDIHKLEIANKDARLVVKEGTKVAKLVIPEGTKRTDLITNYEHCRDRFEDEGNGDGEGVTYPSDDNPTSSDDEDDVTPPADGGNLPPTDGGTTPPTNSTGVTATVGTITQGNNEATKAIGSIGGITYTAKEAGSAGNTIYVSQGNNGISNPLNVQVYDWTPNSVLVGLETSSTLVGPGPTQYEIKSTNNEVKAKVEAHTAASNLVDVTITGDGDSLAINGNVRLSGGSDGIKEKLDLTITHGSENDGTVNVTVNNSIYNVNVVAGDTTDIVALKVATALNGNVEDYNVTALTNVVTFTSKIQGNVQDLLVSID